MKYIVPDGCVFRSVAGVEFNAGEKLPDNYRLKKGDMLLSQDYCYDYLGRNTGGWHISVKDPRKEEYENILSDIAGKPVISMNQTFWGCASLTTAPTIPSSVTDMTHTFRNCRSLTTAPAIPSSVTSMSYTFSGCSSLTGTIEFNANPTYYDDCLKDTQITGITGSCSQETKDALLATK